MSIEDQMHVIGVVLGWIIAAGYVWAVMNFFVKRIYRKSIANLPGDSPRKRRFTWIMHAVTKSHKFVPLFLLTILLLHFLMELIHVGFFATGVIAIVLLLLQISLGVYGATAKEIKTDRWLYAHRTVAVLLFFAIAAHATTAIVLNP